MTKRHKLLTAKPRLTVAAAPGRLKTSTTKARRTTGRALQAERMQLWLERGQCCEGCGRMVEHPYGYELDHIVPLALGGSEEPANKQLLCVETYMGVKIGCHAMKTADEAGEVQVAMYPDWLPNPSHPVHLVFGPPGSGKSTYAVEQAAGRTVIDVDEIAARMFRKPLFHSTDDERKFSIRARNKALANLTGETWLVVTAGTKAKRDWWRRKLHAASWYVMPTPFDECLRRVQADPRRPDHVKARNALEIEKWAKTYDTPPEE
jgi:5-methylcytosine-specific restriction enzyme A